MKINFPAWALELNSEGFVGELGGNVRSPLEVDFKVVRMTACRGARGGRNSHSSLRAAEVDLRRHMATLRASRRCAEGASRP